uniref:Phosphatidylinositol-specific phospholipase C X domain-containing protein n=1 Tax=Cyprinodon variegatus TaxID=28743 RepID=A0A3Q2EKJ7_CYPVA
RERGDSNWMSRLPEELLDVPLWNLAIPGSHDSMSFCLDLSSPVLGSEPFLLRLTDRLLPCWVRPCVYRWSTTQVHGIIIILMQRIYPPKK